MKNSKESKQSNANNSAHLSRTSKQKNYSKQSKRDLQKNEIDAIKKENLSANDAQYAMSERDKRWNFLFPRLKAFLTDMFLINMPILYIVTYMILGGKNAFLHNQLAIAGSEIMYCFILFLFFLFAGQTPGFRYCQIAIISKNGIKPKALNVAIFIIVWIIEVGLFLPLVVYFARRDKKTLHELASGIIIIYKENPAFQRKNR